MTKTTDLKRTANVWDTPFISFTTDTTSAWRDKAARHAMSRTVIREYPDERTAKDLLHQTLHRKIAWRTQHIFIFPKAIFISDLYFPAFRLIVELDGPSHETERHELSDAIRDRQFALYGLLTIRLKSCDVNHDPKLLLRVLRNHLPANAFRKSAWR